MDLIGKSKIILNDDTVFNMIENFIKKELFPGDIEVSDIKHTSYNKEWEITIRQREIKKEKEPRPLADPILRPEPLADPILTPVIDKESSDTEVIT